MGDLQEKIRQAESEVATAAVAAHLDEQGDNLKQLEQILEKTCVLEAVLTKASGDWVYVLPISYKDRGELGSRIASDIQKRLQKYSPCERDVGGKLAYHLTKKKRGKLPQSFDMDVGVKVRMEVQVVDNLDIAMMDDDYHSGRQRAGRRRSRSGPGKQTGIQRRTRTSTFPSLPPEEHYRAIGVTGLTFDIELTDSSFKHNLIPLNNPVRKHFPGFKVPFIIQYDGHDIETRIVSAQNPRSKVGELAGTYASKGLRPLYRAHPELEQTRKLTIRVIKPGKVYKIVGYGK
jgi:hypothetical protein